MLAYYEETGEEWETTVGKTCYLALFGEDYDWESAGEAEYTALVACTAFGM